MLDHDLAELYEVPTKRLNEQIIRNIDRFPSDFIFSLTNQEVTSLKSQIATSSLAWGGHRKFPRAFTEQRIAMLTSVLLSPRAIQVNIEIMRAFVQMRRVLISTQQFENELNRLKIRYDLHDHKFKIVFNALRKLISVETAPYKPVAGLSEKDD